MTQAWLVCTAAMCAWSPTAEHAPSIEVRVGERGTIAPDTDRSRPAPIRCDFRYPVKSPWSFLDPSSYNLPLGDPASHVRANLLPRLPHPEIAPGGMSEEAAGPHQRASGTQAVSRALDILIAVGDGPISLPDLVAKVNIPKPTCHRIATALVERGMLQTSGRSGYRLGPTVIELAEAAIRADGAESGAG